MRARTTGNNNRSDVGRASPRFSFIKGHNCGVLVAKLFDEPRSERSAARIQCSVLPITTPLLFAFSGFRRLQE